MRPLRARPLVRFCTWSFATASALLLGLFLWSLADVLLGAQNRFPNDARADFALVPSGDAGQRSRRAVELFIEGRVDRLLFSGKGNGGDDAVILARHALAVGVPRTRVLTETRATSTCQNIRYVTPVLRALGARSVVIVTDDYHSARVSWHAETEQLLVENCRVWVEPVSADSLKWRVWARESTKLAVARLMWALSRLTGWRLEPC